LDVEGGVSGDGLEGSLQVGRSALDQFSPVFSPLFYFTNFFLHRRVGRVAGEDSPATLHPPPSCKTNSKAFKTCAFHDGILLNKNRFQVKVWGLIEVWICWTFPSRSPVGVSVRGERIGVFFRDENFN
jgi:hypothetical protein